MVEYVKVASLAELPPGSGRSVQVSGKAVALFNVDGQVYAIDGTCLHHGGPLGEGVLESDVVTCPWHLWEYNVRTGEFLANPAIKVVTYPVQVEGDQIKVAV